MLTDALHTYSRIVELPNERLPSKDAAHDALIICRETRQCPGV